MKCLPTIQAWPFGLLLAWVLAVPAGLSGQTAITAVTTITTDSADTVHEGYTFQNTTVALQTFTTSTGTYALTGMADQVFIRRSSGGTNNAHVWYQTASAAGNRIADHADTFQEVLLDNNFARGVHNLFGNAGSSYANIERVDFISNGGFSATADFAIPVFDFGINPQHESFKIALVTSVDAFGNPTGYSALASTVPFTANNVYNHSTFSIHRYADGDNTTDDYAIFNGPNQGPGGVVFTLDDFDVDPGTTIYGYSLFGYDVTDGGNTNNLLNWNSATYFPTNTSDGEGAAGGFDFSGVNGVFFSAVPEPSTYALAGLVAVASCMVLRRRPRCA
ncbi:PEP-CTERM sorting domain-containing protein [Rariglobus hedericola]|uniref:PEP-CTERM sorting domain-containing protein n=1 Tax=Rariglobus hedericola TaxID=2597822 RepID=A0A556QMP8_9BACT|nr:PEP-CTERM sorting domain-containing protein [Rariglobus hedericola]TSJ77918.1 PEP-CTERM sorting domain-containing protein [Rariglobus hedericola]